MASLFKRWWLWAIGVCLVAWYLPWDDGGTGLLPPGAPRGVGFGLLSLHIKGLLPAVPFPVS